MTLSDLPTTAPAVQFDDYGSAAVLHVSDIPVPHPDTGEVLVAVRAAAINPGEIAIRSGAFQSSFPSTLPSGLGTDFAGEIAAIGSDVSAFAVGDEVIGWSEKRSSQATYVAVPQGQLIPKPPQLDWAVAGALFIPAVTAFAAVRAVQVGPGDTVVVSSAGGAVGATAAQLARRRGARVIGIVSEADVEWLRSVDVIPVIRGEGVEGRIRALTPNGVDALIDTFAGGEYVDLGIRLGVAPERIDTVISFEAAQRVGAKTEGSGNASDPIILGEMADLVATGEIELRIAKVFPLAQVREAFELLESGTSRGKIVLEP